jgi:hypothetical protein
VSVASRSDSTATVLFIRLSTRALLVIATASGDRALGCTP